MYTEMLNFSFTQVKTNQSLRPPEEVSCAESNDHRHNDNLVNGDAMHYFPIYAFIHLVIYQNAREKHIELLIAAVIVSVTFGDLEDKDILIEYTHAMDRAIFFTSAYLLGSSSKGYWVERSLGRGGLKKFNPLNEETSKRSRRGKTLHYLNVVFWIILHFRLAFRTIHTLVFDLLLDLTTADKRIPAQLMYGKLILSALHY